MGASPVSRSCCSWYGHPERAPGHPDLYRVKPHLREREREMPKHGASPLGVRDKQEAGAGPPPPPRPGAEHCTLNPSPEPTRGDTSPKGGHPGLLQTLHLAVPPASGLRFLSGSTPPAGRGRLDGGPPGVCTHCPDPGPSQQGSSSQREALEGVKCN